MNATEVKDYLIKHTDKLLELLEHTDFHHISVKYNDIRCAFHEDGNRMAISIDASTMVVRDYVRNINGDIFTLLEYKMKTDFRSVFRYVKAYLNLSNESVEIKPTSRLFGGRYSDKKIITNANIKIYPDDHLSKNYEKIGNTRFLKDGIKVDTQYEYDLHYCNDTNRIIVPYWTENGLVGTVGRLNVDKIEDHQAKWLACDPFPKGHYLYGLYHNYKTIADKKIIFVGESEKFPQQLSSMGIDLGVATGNHNITQQQANQMKYLANKVIVAYDEDVCEEEVREQCKKIRTGLFNDVEIEYIYDRDKVIMKEGSKTSPTDFGIDGFEYLMKNCRHKI